MHTFGWRGGRQVFKASTKVLVGSTRMFRLVALCAELWKGFVDNPLFNCGAIWHGYVNSGR